MAADVTGFLAVVMMALATLTAIIGGYLLLNTAVSNIARGSSYYTYLRISDSISNSFRSGSASATNLFLSPQYVIFTASFDNEEQIPYYAFDGQKMNHITVNFDKKNELYEQIVMSSSGLAVFNSDVTNRNELQKCAHDTCICLGEMTSTLSLEEEYLTPGACVEICWGEDLHNYPDTEGYTNYDSCLLGDESESPREAYTACNTQAASRSKNVNCRRCVNFMKDYDDKFVLFEEEGYKVLGLEVDDIEDTNLDNVEYLQDFSLATKYSFIPNIIECKSMSELSLTAGKNSYCNAGPPIAPYLFNYINSTGHSGIFAIMGVNAEYSDGVLFKLFNIDYFQDETIKPSTCYSATTFITTEERSSEEVSDIGGFV